MKAGTPSSDRVARGRAYMKRLSVSLALYMLTLFGANWLLALFGDNQAQRVLISILPVVPMLLMLRAIILFIRDVDELERKIIIEAQIIATILVGFGSFAYGFLEQGAGFPKLPTFTIMPALFAIYGIAVIFVRRRYG